MFQNLIWRVELKLCCLSANLALESLEHRYSAPQRASSFNTPFNAVRSFEAQWYDLALNPKARDFISTFDLELQCCRLQPHSQGLRMNLSSLNLELRSDLQCSTRAVALQPVASSFISSFGLKL